MKYLRKAITIGVIVGVLLAGLAIYTTMILPLRELASLNFMAAQNSAATRPSGAGPLTGGNRLPKGIDSDPTPAPLPTSAPASVSAPTASVPPAVAPAPAPVSESCETQSVMAVAEAMERFEISLNVNPEGVHVRCLNGEGAVVKEESYSPTSLCESNVSAALEGISSAIAMTDTGFNSVCVHGNDVEIASTAHTLEGTWPDAVLDCTAQIETAVDTARAEERARPVKIAVPGSCFDKLVSETPDDKGCYTLYCEDFNVFRKQKHDGTRWIDSTDCRP